MRISNDYEKVFADFPIGHHVEVNGINATVIGHTGQEIYGSQCLFVVILAWNGDGMTIDPYFWKLTPFKAYGGSPESAKTKGGKSPKA